MFVRLKSILNCLLNVGYFLCLLVLFWHAWCRLKVIVQELLPRSLHIKERKKTENPMATRRKICRATCFSNESYPKLSRNSHVSRCFGINYLYVKKIVVFFKKFELFRRVNVICLMQYLVHFPFKFVLKIMTHLYIYK